ncbi:MAG TPA: sulfotransferase [Acetobacteraceae bacterium]
MRTKPESPEQDRPVFVLAQHRSGGTLLTRLLNCHPGLVIWGEHAGFLNKLAEAQDMLDRHAGLLPQRSPAELRHYVSGRVGDAFLPWTVPFGGAAFLAGCRTMVRGLFAPGLRPGQRWGFKEIRYHSPTVVRFLRRLFPAAQFILLNRDPIELCVSDMLVSWALGSLMAERVQTDRRAFLAAVDDCLYAILAVRENLTHARAAIADQSIAVRYEALVSTPEAEMADILGFLRLPDCAGLSARLRLVARTVTGATDKAPVLPAGDLGLLTAPCIREAAERLLPSIAAGIARDGVNAARLRREQQEEGRFSYLLGDHAVAETSFSTMF